MPQETGKHTTWEFVPINRAYAVKYQVRGTNADGSPFAVTCLHEDTARLIAAAPDLYAACRMALDAHQYNHALDWSALKAALLKAQPFQEEESK